MSGLFQYIYDLYISILEMLEIYTLRVQRVYFLNINVEFHIENTFFNVNEFFVFVFFV